MELKTRALHKIFLWVWITEAQCFSGAFECQKLILFCAGDVKV